MPARRILDVFNMAANVCLYRRVFEHAVAGLVEGAVLEHEVLRIAQQLLASQMTVYETYVLRVPCQILAIEYGVVDGHILALPERVLRQYLSVVYLHILAVLEHVLGIAIQAVDADVLTEHERVGAAVQGNILQSKAIHLPERLVSIGDVDIFQHHILHFAEEFRAVDATTPHHQIVGVPDGGTRALGEVAVLNECAVNVPPRIFAIEATVLGLHILTLLDATLAVCDGDILQSQVVGGKKGPLSPEFLVFDQFHVRLLCLWLQRYENFPNSSFLIPIFFVPLLAN